MASFHLKRAPEVLVSLRKSRRAKRLSLRVSSLDGRVTLTLPEGTPERVGRAFAEEKARWLADTVGKVAPPILVTVGTKLSVLDRLVPVTSGRSRAARLTSSAIEAPPDHAGPAIELLLNTLARDRLTHAVSSFGAKLGKKSGRLTLRDTRSRWGSCSSDGNLMFSWRLVMAPIRVLDYVAAHEVAHLAHMDHSPAFWATVEDLFGDHRAERTWLRQNGASLHRFLFRAQD